MQEWRTITSFPSYSVSDLGWVRNEDSGRVLSVLVNQRGIAHVGLTRDHVQHKRSLSVLVCDAFRRKEHATFNTPINLNGDRLDNRADNLVWRPRWFATKYFGQFRVPKASIDRPVEELGSGVKFENSWYAAIAFGLLDREILAAIAHHTWVWPTRQRFRVL